MGESLEGFPAQSTVWTSELRSHHEGCSRAYPTQKEKAPCRMVGYQ